MQKKWRLLWISLMAVLALALVSGCLTTQKTTKKAAADASWQFHDIVNVKFVRQYVKMPKPKDVVIIDARPKKPKYDKGYIPTAICIPGSKFASMTDKLPKDKNTLLIFYCGGPT